MFLATDLTELPAKVRQRMHQILTDQNARAMVQARIDQEQVAKFYHNNRPRSLDGLGGMEMSMMPYWVNYFRMKLGNERFQQDPDVKKWILKKEEMFRVRHTGTKLLFGSAAIPGSVKRSFKKVYQPTKTTNN